MLRPDSEHRVWIGEEKVKAEFQTELTRLLGAPYSLLLTNSCTSALDTAFHLCGIGPGDEVVTTPVTCLATNVGLLHRGAKIVWADVDPLTGLIDPKDVKEKVSPKTKAIVAVDWGGRLCNYRALKAIGPPVVQDAAHSLLAESRGSGMFTSGWFHGDYVCFSFGPIKHLTCGDGGALFVPVQEWDRARLLIWFGLDRFSSTSFRCKQRVGEAGYKYNMNDISASIGLANLSRLPWALSRHRENAEFYFRRLKGLRTLSPAPPDSGCSWWLYGILAEKRDVLSAFLGERGIESSPVYLRNDEQPAFVKAAGRSGRLLGVESFGKHALAIPVGWWVTREDREIVAKTLEEWDVQCATAGIAAPPVSISSPFILKPERKGTPSGAVLQDSGDILNREK